MSIFLIVETASMIAVALVSQSSITPARHSAGLASLCSRDTSCWSFARLVSLGPAAGTDRTRWRSGRVWGVMSLPMKLGCA